MPSRCFLMVMASRLNGASRSVWSSHRGIQQRADLRDIRVIGEHRAQRLLESEAACGPRVSALQPVHLVDLLACQLFGALGCASADAAQLGAVLTSARRAWSSAGRQSGALTGVSHTASALWQSTPMHVIRAPMRRISGQLPRPHRYHG